MAATARLEARITPEVQRQLKRAAELQGRSLSDFVVSAAIQEAQKTIERTGGILLTIDEQARLHDALRNPPAPTEQLRQAVARRRELFGE